MMRKALLLLLAAVLCGSLPAQDTEETARLLALFNSHPKADIAVELVKKYEGLHDRSDYPYYGYGHRRLPNEKLSYGMTESEAEALLRKDLAVRYRLFRKYGKDALLLSEISDNKSESRPKPRNMAHSFLRSERSKASACRSVIFGENRSPGNSLCPYPT